jgi:hypothetical protein
VQILQQISESAKFTVNGTNQLVANATFQPAAGVVWANSLCMASLIVALASVSELSSNLGFKFTFHL